MFGIIYLIVGFWKTVVFMMFVGLGYLWGWRLDRREDMEKVVSAILSDKWIRNRAAGPTARVFLCGEVRT